MGQLQGENKTKKVLQLSLKFTKQNALIIVNILGTIFYGPMKQIWNLLEGEDPVRL